MAGRGVHLGFSCSDSRVHGPFKKIGETAPLDVAARLRSTQRVFVPLAKTLHDGAHPHGDIHGGFVNRQRFVVAGHHSPKKIAQSQNRMLNSQKVKMPVLSAHSEHRTYSSRRSWPCCRS